MPTPGGPAWWRWGILNNGGPPWGKDAGAVADAPDTSVEGGRRQVYVDESGSPVDASGNPLPTLELVVADAPQPGHITLLPNGQIVDPAGIPCDEHGVPLDARRVFVARAKGSATARPVYVDATGRPVDIDGNPLLTMPHKTGGAPRPGMITDLPGGKFVDGQGRPCDRYGIPLDAQRVFVPRADGSATAPPVYVDATGRPPDPDTNPPPSMPRKTGGPPRPGMITDLPSGKSAGGQRGPADRHGTPPDAQPDSVLQPTRSAAPPPVHVDQTVRPVDTSGNPTLMPVYVPPQDTHRTAATGPDTGTDTGSQFGSPSSTPSALTGSGSTGGVFGAEPEGVKRGGVDFGTTAELLRSIHADLDISPAELEYMAGDGETGEAFKESFVPMAEAVWAFLMLGARLFELHGENIVDLGQLLDSVDEAAAGAAGGGFGRRG